MDGISTLLLFIFRSWKCDISDIISLIYSANKTKWRRPNYNGDYIERFISAITIAVYCHKLASASNRFLLFQPVDVFIWFRRVCFYRFAIDVSSLLIAWITTSSHSHTGVLNSNQILIMAWYAIVSPMKFQLSCNHFVSHNLPSKCSSTIFMPLAIIVSHTIQCLRTFTATVVALPQCLRHK